MIQKRQLQVKEHRESKEKFKVIRHVAWVFYEKIFKPEITLHKMHFKIYLYI